MKLKKQFFLLSLLTSSAIILIGCEEKNDPWETLVNTIQEDIKMKNEKLGNVNEDDLISIVKDSEYDYYSKSGTRIEDAFSNFFSSPTWKCIEFEKADKENIARGVVEFEGYFPFNDEKVKITMLFKVRADTKYSGAYKIYYNDGPIDDGFKNRLLSEIYYQMYNQTITYNNQDITESTSPEPQYSQFDTEYDMDYIGEFVIDYVVQLAESVNYGDASGVQWYLKPNSQFYTQQTDLVHNLNSRNIQEYVLDTQILDVRQLNTNTFEVDSYEQIEIVKQDVSEIKEFNWTYTVIFDGTDYYISNLK